MSFQNIIISHFNFIYNFITLSHFIRTSLNLDNVKEDLCKDIFVRHSNASCILYDDEKCDGSEGIRKLSAGESFVNGTTALGFDVESISIKDGCQIKIFSGNHD